MATECGFRLIGPLANSSPIVRNNGPEYQRSIYFYEIEYLCNKPLWNLLYHLNRL